MSVLGSDLRGLIVMCRTCGKQNRLAFSQLGKLARCGQCHGSLDTPAGPLEVKSQAQFDALVRESRLPVLVDFWAAWCGPCRMVSPQVEQVARQNVGRLFVAKVDTDALADLSTRLGIRSLPTLAVFVGGKEKNRTAGAMPAERIEAFVRDAVGGEEPSLP